MRNRINNILKDIIAPNSKEYEIQKGDTLSDISLREGISVEDLAQVNEIENPNLILEGGTHAQLPLRFSAQSRVQKL